MIRISTIFIAICMVLVAASLGLILYSLAGISGLESAIVALTALTFLILYNAVSMRLRDRTDVGGQIADFSRGTADLARQIAEFGRRLAAIEGKMVSANRWAQNASSRSSARSTNLAGWLNSSQPPLPAMTICCPLVAAAAPCRQEDETERPSGLGRDRMSWQHRSNRQPVAATAKPTIVAENTAPSRSQTQILAATKSAIEENRLESICSRW